MAPKFPSAFYVLSGIVLGTIGTLLFSFSNSITDGARQFNYQGKLIIKTDQPDHADQIYVGNPTNNYMTNFDAYLRSITNEAERASERAKIEKLVEKKD